jgi:hypothetical protein
MKWYGPIICFLLPVFTGCNYLQCQQIQKSGYAIFNTGRRMDGDKLLASVDAGISFRKYRWGALQVESNLYKFWDKNYSMAGVGIRPGAYLYCMRRTGYAIFTEVKGGVMYMLPEENSNRFNFTFVCGIGMEIKLFNGNFLRTSVSYGHFSNGRRDKEVNNPTWDGLMIGAGWIVSNK